jgi:hopanoid biosynthesis associated RND transporter like protein HpnN
MHPEQASGVKRSATSAVIVRLVSMACRFPRFTLLAALLLAGVSAYIVITRLEYHTQRSDLMGEHSESLKRWKQFVAEFGDDDDMVVVVRGQDPEQMKQALEAVADQVSDRPEQFDRLFYKVDLRHLQNRALLYLSADQIHQIQIDLQSMQRLLGPGEYGWQLCTLGSMANEARLRLGKLPRIPVVPGRPHEDEESSRQSVAIYATVAMANEARLGPEKPPPSAEQQALPHEDEEFYRQLNAICKAAASEVERPTHHPNPWTSMVGGQADQQNLMSEPQYFFNGDRSMAFLLLRPVKAAESFTPAQASVTALRDIVGRVRDSYADVEIGVTGLPVLETDEMLASQRDTKTAGWMALAGVLVLGLVFFRGIRYPLLAMVTLIFGTIWAAGWLTVTVGHVNILSATFAMMLIGLGDYGAVWIANYEQARRHGADVPAALRFTARTIGPSIFMAGLTSSLAFFAAMLADFHAVTELGWIAGCGVQLCVLSTYTTLPALLRLTDRRGVLPQAADSLRVFDPRGHHHRSAEDAPPSWLPGLARRPGLVAGVCLAITLVLGAFAWRIQYDHNLLHLQASGLESVQWETALINGTSGATWHAVSYTETPEEALARKAEFEKLDCVSRVVDLASLIPADQDRKMEQLRDIQQRLQFLPPREFKFSQVFPTAPRALTDEINRLLPALEVHSGLRSPLLDELSDNLRDLRGKIQALPSKTATARLRAFDHQLVMGLIDNLHQLRDVATPAPIVLEDLPASFRERYLGKDGKWLLRVFAKQSLWDYEPLQHFVDEVRTVDAEATGKPFGTLEGLRGMKSSFLWSAVYATLVIVLALVLGFRSIKCLLLLMVPLVMGALITLGTMALCGWPLNPANVIALPIVVGVGVVNAVHVMHDYLLRRGRPGYCLNRAIGKGLLVSALNTVLGFGTLMISSHRGLVSLGFMLALGVFCCMAMGQVFLPAVLNLLSRRAQQPAQLPPAELAPLRRAA